MFSTHLLDDAARRRAERMEARRRVVLERVVATLESEGPRLGVSEAYLVGSVISEGEWAEDSDVDVAISGGDPIRVMRIVEEAAGSAVDVIDLERHPTPEMFRRRGRKVVG